MHLTPAKLFWEVVRPPDKSVFGNYFSYVLTNIYVGGTQSNCFIETVPFNSQNTGLNLWVRKLLHFKKILICTNGLYI